ncbi:transmembrane protease serine 9-like isoform X1 [Canis lupus familiaris]|nr:tryptase gamma-like [Canis lupus dingo]XP_038406670.1 transmembrane protease serine 9-like isoform X1 [Canis lupus familiaris]XP_038525582.1 transmembrane protease serine 9-like isoform X1 [Canis lupus familiaris]
MAVHLAPGRTGPLCPPSTGPAAWGALHSKPAPPALAELDSSLEPLLARRVSRGQGCPRRSLCLAPTCGPGWSRGSFGEEGGPGRNALSPAELGGRSGGRHAAILRAHRVLCPLPSVVTLQDLSVQLGESVLYTHPRDSVSAAVIRVIQHPSFNGDALQGGNVALVKLARPVAFSRTTRPIPLAPPGSYFPAGTLCWVTGWGGLQAEWWVRDRGLGQREAPQRGLPSAPHLTLGAGLGHILHCSAGFAQASAPRDTCAGHGGGPAELLPLAPPERRLGAWRVTARWALRPPATVPCPAEALLEPHRLQEVDVRTVGLESCRRLYYPEPIAADMLYAGSSRGQKGFCEGDSGGPLVCQLWGRRWVQAAVVSFSRGCAEPGFPGVYVRVSAYWTWIQRHLLPRGSQNRGNRRG